MRCAGEERSLGIINRFYSLARVLFAANTELCAMLAATTGRACHLMQRGVDTTLFSPKHRGRSARAGEPFIPGYVGHLSIERNVALLPAIQRELRAAGMNVRFVIIGDGAEEQMLRREHSDADFAGVLRCAALSRGYAEMDLLVFPSHTDTFGNVVLEALASGVPAIVTPDGGPKYIVRHGETGFIAQDAAFAGAIAAVLRDPERLAGMRIAACCHASTCSWDAVFDSVYAAYGDALEPRERFVGDGTDSNPGWRGSSPM